MSLLNKKGTLLHGAGKDIPDPQGLAALMIHNSHIGIFLINDTFECIYANDEVARIMDYPIEEIVGSDFRRFLPKESKEAIGDLYVRRQNGEALPLRYEAEFVRKGGERRTAEISVDAMMTIDKQVVTVVQVFDITDRKRMEEDLEKSEKKYHDFFENVLDFIFIHDLDGNLIESNARYATEVGARPDVIATANLRDLVPEQFRPECDHYLTRIRRNGRDEGIIAIQVPEGEVRILEYKNLLLLDYNQHAACVMGSARDITEHIRDKKALRESKERYQMILDNVGDYIYELDLVGNYTFVNNALVKRSGYTREELIGKNFREYTFPQEKADLKAYHYQIYKTGETGKGMQHRVIRKDGSPIDIELVASLIKNDDGNPTGFRGIARDITERKL